MNYYPTNFYSNYQQYPNNYTQQGIQNSLPAPQMQQPQMTIPGKIVDSLEVARVSDIPFGGYGIFPKADLSEVYIKMWNNNGTTSLVSFKPVIEGKIVKQYEEGEELTNNNQELLEKIKQLETKLDNLINESNQKNNTQKRKELSASAY